VAQNRYAKLLAVGEGVDLDLQEAAMWRALARRQGLIDPVLDKLLISTPAADLKKAEERARFWPSAPPTAEAAAQPVPPPTPLPATDPASPGTQPAPSNLDAQPTPPAVDTTGKSPPVPAPRPTGKKP
jgi:hypothetical protein